MEAASPKLSNHTGSSQQAYHLGPVARYGIFSGNENNTLCLQARTIAKPKAEITQGKQSQQAITLRYVSGHIAYRAKRAALSWRASTRRAAV